MNENERGERKERERERERRRKRRGQARTIEATSAVVALPHELMKGERKWTPRNHRPASCVLANQPVITKIVSNGSGRLLVHFVTLFYLG